MQKKLTKSATDRKVCDVCGGIAEYINLDPTVVRVLWVLFSLWGIGVLAYLACTFIMPD